MFSRKYPNTYLDTYPGFKHYIAQARAKLYAEAKFTYLAKARQGYCSVCKKRLKWKEKTVDHIIPMSIIMEKELFGLWLDHRNFQILCKPCNMYKSSSTEELPESVVSRLKDF